jgi:histidine triad (HIT) family protein
LSGIWEDEQHLAFLSIFPNTAGFSVVITKPHYPSYAFDLPDEVLTSLVLAARQVGSLLDRRLEDVGRTGMILEGFGVDHAHARLFPMHGTMTAAWRPLSRPADKYFHQYEGYISSHDHRPADDQELAALARKIRE